MKQSLPTVVSTPHARRALAVHARLAPVYGTPVPFFQTLDPLSELVSSLLSHRTKNKQSGEAFARLRERFPAWEGVRDAPVELVREAIRPCTWPELKAPRLQEVLRAITAARRELSLEFLRGWPVPEARAWLESLPGVGPKTSAATLLFSDLRMPALPVDSHHHRVAARLELVPPGCSLEKAHAILAGYLPADWGAQAVYDHHELLMFHGQRCCFPAKPDCAGCAVRDLCPAATPEARLPPAADRPARTLFDGAE